MESKNELSKIREENIELKTYPDIENDQKNALFTEEGNNNKIIKIIIKIY